MKRAHHEHWHYLRHHRRKHGRRSNTKEIFLGQVISLTGSIIAGYILDLTKNQLVLVAGVFLIMPGVFDLGGAIAGAMAARINHQLGEGGKEEKVFRGAFIHALSLIAVSSIFLGIFGASLAAIFFNADYVKILAICIGSCVLAAVLGLPIVGAGTIFAFKRGADADNFIGPIETSIFDALSILAVCTMVIILR